MHHKVEMPNGLTILAEEIRHLRSVALGVWVDVGSRYEEDDERGISHFIEHMMFKGTLKRTAKDIAEALDAVGGQLNAFTTKEYTCYFARVLDEHFDLALDLLGDMLFNSRLEGPDVDRERNVILEEIKMYEDTPDELVHDLFTATLWEGHHLGQPIIGSVDTVQNLSRDDLANFHGLHYRPGGMVVAVAGNVDHQVAVEKIKARFAGEGRARERRMGPPAAQNGIMCRAKDTEQVHLCVGVPGYALSDERIYAVQVINTILGGGISSRLFQEIREKRGLVYSVYSYHSSYHDTGVFGIYAGLGKDNVGQAMELVMQEIGEIQKGAVAEEELVRARDQLKGNLYLSLENVNTRMSRLGKSQLYLGTVQSPEELVERVAAVTRDDIVRLALDLFRPERFALASIGPWQDQGEWRTVLGRLAP
ncbi:MAG: pitrilysin family protein [Peptococcaceae bacterium]|jgi:predicted Zn-dependent peptidase|nr:pitrilysin family protein [Peptococcaceae bacterium]